MIRREFIAAVQLVPIERKAAGQRVDGTKLELLRLRRGSRQYGCRDYSERDRLQ
jgi:hypothetical protein